MIGKTNVGGGGGGLNFKVVGGTTQPASPRENTIWVNTSAEITEYTFSSSEPTGSEGLVWFETSRTSNVSFSATKKNPVMVYPMLAHQYTSGVWTDKDAQIYQNGEWVGWTTYLYQNGDEFSDRTGGWSFSGGYTGSGWSLGTITKGASAITLSVWSASVTTVAPANAVDLTRYHTLFLTVSAVSSGTNRKFKFAVCSTREEAFDPGAGDNNVPASTLSYVEITAPGTVSIDLTSLSGYAYPKVIASSHSDGQSISFTEVYLQ